jgi:hypothetical protein
MTSRSRARRAAETAGWLAVAACSSSALSGPALEVMCSDICIHSVPLLAGFCVSTRRIQDRVFCFRVLQAHRKTARIGLCPQRCGGLSWTAVQAHACRRVWSVQLISSADRSPSSQELQMALISTGRPGVAALHRRSRVRPPRKELASRFGEVKVGCKRRQSKACMAWVHEVRRA